MANKRQVKKNLKKYGQETRGRVRKSCPYCKDPAYGKPFRDSVDGEKGTWHHNLPGFPGEATDCMRSDSLETRHRSSVGRAIG